MRITSPGNRVLSKVSELVPGSLHPRSNSMWFFMGDQSIKRCSLGRGDLWTSTGKVQTHHECWNLYKIGSRTRWHCEISKKLTLNPTKVAKNTLFLFPDMGLSLIIFALGIPLHANVFSFTHNAVVLSQFRCVYLKNQTKVFWFWHFYE